jgi:hypothetical protein
LKVRARREYFAAGPQRKGTNPIAFTGARVAALRIGGSNDVVGLFRVSVVCSPAVGRQIRAVDDHPGARQRERDEMVAVHEKGLRSTLCSRTWRSTSRLAAM